MSNDPTTAGDPQDMAEALDSDKLGTPDDPDVEPGFPPDRLSGANQYGTSAAEEQIPEPLAERVLRERPEPLADELDDAAEAQVDPVELAGADGLLGDPPDGVVGRLVEPDAEDVSWVDDEATSVARGVSQKDLSAEELAVHRTESP